MDDLPTDAGAINGDRDGPRLYRCAVPSIFLKRSEDPSAGQIVKLRREVGAEVQATGKTWTGPGGGIWAELEPSAGSGWALVRGAGFGLTGPALVDPSGGSVVLGRVPRCFVFDLDNCCWTPEMYEMSAGAPFAYDPERNICRARSGRGEQVRLLGDVAAVWHAIHTDPQFEGSRIAVASCCDEPAWAQELLGLFEVGSGTKMKDCIAHAEIRFDNKQVHLRRISEQLRIPLEEMVFFDDQSGHCCDARDIGVTAVQTPWGGVTHEKFSQALEDFARGTSSVRGS
mmetsp:Transcript_73380/g.215122  ORF Transcript_73380/g.215122 Transcript_73380/m.215122 type:complete len:285 (+) Transcript_73380:91-945(+)